MRRTIRFKIGSVPITLSRASFPFSLVFLTGLVAGFLSAWFAQPELFSSDNENRKIYVCFSPGGNCEQLILKAIFEAKTNIFVQAYAFTSKPVAQALMDAFQRGVQVRVLCDKGQFSMKHSVVHRLQSCGIEVVPDLVRGLAHNKILLIDGKRLLLGSYNFTHAANHANAENLLCIQDPKLYEIYLKNWEKRYQESRDKM
ncbi:MAG: phospholipase D family protein [Alphaproteobacteria bacterium]